MSKSKEVKEDASGEVKNDTSGGSIIRTEHPPNIDQIKESFGEEAIKPGVVYTYYPNIYSPSSPNIPEDLLRHEVTHLRQQEKEGAVKWWDRYLSDKAFRIEQEVEAYGNQYAYFKTAPNSLKKQVLTRLALDLSGPMYGKCLTYERAETLIRQYAKNLD